MITSNIQIEEQNLVRDTRPGGLGLVKKSYQPRNRLKNGEKTIKAWKMEMAEKLGVTSAAIEHRLSYGSLPYPPCRRVNRRVVIVLPNNEASNGTRQKP